jgi:hypothetical protein
MILSKKKQTGALLALVALGFLLGISWWLLRGAGGVAILSCNDCNIIVITLTNLRYDHMSQNGYERPTTPNLDAWAKDALVFDNAFSHASWTLPAGISLFTSLYPFEHGVMDRHDGSALSASTPTLVDILNDAGYRTAAITGGFDYNPAFGLTNRYQEYEECAEASAEGATRIDITGYGHLNCAMPKALEWISDNRGEKFFVHVQGYDVHCPFSIASGNMYDAAYGGDVDFSDCLWTFEKTDPIEKHDKVVYPVYTAAMDVLNEVFLGEKDIFHLIALYDEAITRTDGVIGAFLSSLQKMGLTDNTIVIFTSEHGDMFGKHGRFMRGGPLRGTMYDDVLHVPLIVKHPKLSGARFDGLVSQINVAPTLLDFLSLPKSGSFTGESLAPLTQEKEKPSNYIYAGAEYNPAANNFYVNQRTRVEAVRTNEWKLIREIDFPERGSSGALRASHELYNLRKDPQELVNLATQEVQTLKELSQNLDEWSLKTRE